MTYATLHIAGLLGVFTKSTDGHFTRSGYEWAHPDGWGWWAERGPTARLSGGMRALFEKMPTLATALLFRDRTISAGKCLNNLREFPIDAGRRRVGTRRDRPPVPTMSFQDTFLDATLRWTRWPEEEQESAWESVSLVPLGVTERSPVRSPGGAARVAEWLDEFGGTVGVPSVREVAENILRVHVREEDTRSARDAQDLEARWVDAKTPCESASLQAAIHAWKAVESHQSGGTQAMEFQLACLCVGNARALVTQRSPIGEYEYAATRLRETLTVTSSLGRFFRGE